MIERDAEKDLSLEDLDDADDDEDRRHDPQQWDSSCDVCFLPRGGVGVGRRSEDRSVVSIVPRHAPVAGRCPR